MIGHSSIRCGLQNPEIEQLINDQMEDINFRFGFESTYDFDRFLFTNNMLAFSRRPRRVNPQMVTNLDNMGGANYSGVSVSQEDIDSGNQQWQEARLETPSLDSSDEEMTEYFLATNAAEPPQETFTDDANTTHTTHSLQVHYEFEIQHPT